MTATEIWPQILREDDMSEREEIYASDKSYFSSIALVRY